MRFLVAFLCAVVVHSCGDDRASAPPPTAAQLNDAGVRPDVASESGCPDADPRPVLHVSERYGWSQTPACEWRNEPVRCVCVREN